MLSVLAHETGRLPLGPKSGWLARRPLRLSSELALLFIPTFDTHWKKPSTTIPRGRRQSLVEVVGSHDSIVDDCGAAPERNSIAASDNSSV